MIMKRLLLAVFLIVTVMVAVLRSQVLQNVSGTTTTSDGTGVSNVPIANVTSPGVIVTNGESASITVSNTWQIAFGSTLATSKFQLRANPANPLVITNILLYSAALDFPSTASTNCSDLIMTNSLGSTLHDGLDVPILGIPSAVLTNNVDWSCFVTATNTVAVRFCNFNPVAINPPSGTFTVLLIQR